MYRRIRESSSTISMRGVFASRAVRNRASRPLLPRLARGPPESLDRSETAEASVEADEWEAKEQAAHSDLREATTRQNAAEVVLEQMQAGCTWTGLRDRHVGSSRR